MTELLIVEGEGHCTSEASGALNNVRHSTDGRVPLPCILARAHTERKEDNIQTDTDKIKTKDGDVHKNDARRQGYHRT